MDPSVYARAHGVQSEANTVTVTRVACGEIMYRRAVDTYRRDMKYKLNCLRREQKRLRGCIRGYRRKLRESGQSKTGEQAMASRKDLRKGDLPFIDHLTVDGKPDNIAVSSAPSLFTASDSYLLIESDNARKKHNASSAPTAEKQFPHGTNAVDTSLSSRSCHPSISQTGKTNNPSSAKPSVIATGKETKDEILDYCPILPDNVGRTVRKGSGKIGASSRQVYVSVADSELEDDTFADMSDSSDDEDKSQEGRDSIEVVTFRNGVFVREITPLTLMKGKAAYFKSVSKDVDAGREVNKDDHERVDGNNAIGKSAYEEPENLQLNKEVPSGGKLAANGQSLATNIPLKSMVDIPNQSNKKSNSVKGQPNELPKLIKVKEKVGVSFNDIIKISISNNTKKLFSLVDRLAKTNGIPVTPIDRPTASLIKKDPRELVAAVRRAQGADVGSMPSRVAARGSVFYAIKYGYISDPGDDKKRQDISHPSSNDSQIEDGILTPDLIPDLKSPFDAGIAPAVKPIISLNASDNTRIFPTPLSLAKSEEGRQLSHKTSELGNGSDLSYYGSDHACKQRDKRRSSILEASNFVSESRRRRNFLPSQKGSEENMRRMKLITRPPKDSVKREIQEVSDNHKEPWASALSRIKMIHTLVDLTNII